MLWMVVWSPKRKTVWFRFGSVRFRFLVFAIGPVRFMFGFGSCGSWSISVRFGVWNILHWYLLFFRRRKSKYRLLPARGLLLPARGFMSRGFQRAERAELGKPKLPEIASACNLLWRNLYLFFSLNSKSNYNIYNFSNQFMGEGKTVPVPPVRFCTRFQRFTVPTVHRLFDFLRFGSTVPVRFLNLTENGMAFFQKYKPSYYASDLQGTPQDHQDFHEQISKSPFASPKDHKKQISINAAKNIQTIQNPKKK